MCKSNCRLAALVGEAQHANLWPRLLTPWRQGVQEGALPAPPGWPPRCQMPPHLPEPPRAACSCRARSALPAALPAASAVMFAEASRAVHPPPCACNHTRPHPTATCLALLQLHRGWCGARRAQTQLHLLPRGHDQQLWQGVGNRGGPDARSSWRARGCSTAAPRHNTLMLACGSRSPAGVSCSTSACSSAAKPCPATSRPAPPRTVAALG